MIVARSSVPMTPDPTPEQIARRAARIRKGWTPAEHRRRIGGNGLVRWTTPVIAVGSLEHRSIVENEINAVNV